MTQQYLIGQFSALLGELQPTGGEGLTVAVHQLRREVERSPLPMLPQLAQAAMSLTDMVCWAALEDGNPDGFCRCAETASTLREFAGCAGLLPE
ncbi:MAG TPA: hypothetical protein VF781_13940 [Solirubrobacteraceae bacterium]